MSVAGLVPGLLQEFAPRWQLREIRLPGSRFPNVLEKGGGVVAVTSWALTDQKLIRHR